MPTNGTPCLQNLRLTPCADRAALFPSEPRLSVGTQAAAKRSEPDFIDYVVQLARTGKLECSSNRSGRLAFVVIGEDHYEPHPNPVLDARFRLAANLADGLQRGKIELAIEESHFATDATYNRYESAAEQALGPIIHELPNATPQDSDKISPSFNFMLESRVHRNCSKHKLLEMKYNFG